jgi:hypothetical protein
MTIKRKCPNWLDTFLEWTLPRSEAKESLIYWSGMFTLASTMGKRIRLLEGLLGSWNTNASMYITFVGPQGAIRKSTTTGYAEQLLDQIVGLNKSPEVFTSPALLEFIGETDDAAAFGIISELAILLEKDKTLYSILTSLFDGKKNYTESTIGRGAKFIERPCYSMIGATTPLWISENMTEAMLGGGYGSRVIYINENTVRRKQLFYRNINLKHYEELESNLVHDLQFMKDTIKGEFDVAADAEAYLEKWYQDIPDVDKIKDPKLIGFYQRLPAHTIKVAMLLHVCYADDLLITLDDAKKAVRVMGLVEPSILKTMHAIRSNIFAASMESITEYIKNNGPLEKAQVLRQFQGAASPDKLELLIQGLVSSMTIKSYMNKEDAKQYLEYLS